MPIPRDAIGLMIGKGGKTINDWKKLDGIESITLNQTGGNWGELKIVGTYASIERISRRVCLRLWNASPSIQNATDKTASEEEEK